MMLIDKITKRNQRVSEGKNMTTMNRLYCKSNKCCCLAHLNINEHMLDFVYPFVDKYERGNVVLDIDCSD